MLFGQEHVKRYQETGGEEGHDWQDTVALLLTTTGRKSGEDRTTPLIYQPWDDTYLIVASNGGGAPPAWFLNLEDDPSVTLQVKDEVFGASARVATPEERAEMWTTMTAAWPPYDEYQEKADREIPIIVLERS